MVKTQSHAVTNPEPVRFTKSLLSISEEARLQAEQEQREKEERERLEREEKERLAQQVGIINFILHFYRFKPRFVSITICDNELFRTFFSKRVFLVSCLAAIIRLGVVYTVQLLLTTVACNCRLAPTRH